MTGLLVLTPLLPLLALLPGGRWALPLLAPLTLYFAFRERVRARNYVGAWGLGMLWAALLSAGVIALVFWRPEAAREGILNGEPYRQAMFGWIETGAGRENMPSEFIPEHLLHLGVFILLTWLTGGYLGLALGAALTAYMSYFVGSYAADSGQPFLVSLVAWVPWSVVRVMAFVLLGCLFARPLMVKRIWPFEGLEYRLMALALAGILTDIVMKSLLAPHYGVWLRQLASQASGSL